jgi:hypothetical protein
VSTRWHGGAEEATNLVPSETTSGEVGHHLRSGGIEADHFGHAGVQPSELQKRGEGLREGPERSVLRTNVHAPRNTCCVQRSSGVPRHLADRRCDTRKTEC